MGIMAHCVNKKNKEYKMKYLAAYCLLALSGKDNITADALKKFCKEAGSSDINDDKAKQVCDALSGKELHEVISAGLGKLGSVSLGGGNAGGSGPAPAQQQGGDAKKEDAPAQAQEEEEEDSVSMGGLFD